MFDSNTDSKQKWNHSSSISIVHHCCKPYTPRGRPLMIWGAEENSEMNLIFPFQMFQLFFPGEEFFLGYQAPLPDH